MPLRSTVGWGGKARRDRSIQDRPLSIAGKEYARGIGAHARSEMVYEIERPFRRFVAVAGVDDEMKAFPGMGKTIIGGKHVAFHFVYDLSDYGKLKKPTNPPKLRSSWRGAEERIDGSERTLRSSRPAGFEGSFVWGGRVVSVLPAGASRRTP
jgi:NPCBM/NEW2 domain-containing protein